MAHAIHHSRSVLADAAAGHRCPTWQVTYDFIKACQGDPDDSAWKTLWEAAQAADERTRATSRQPRRSRAARSTSRNTARDAFRGSVSVIAPEPVAASPPTSTVPPPDPRQARTDRQFRLQLRRLRAWAGNPRPGQRLPRSTMYDALHPAKSGLPDLAVVRIIVEMCHGDADAWIDVWRRLMMAEFDRVNPDIEDLD
ncbi:hypothetical protein J5X84_41170 [Streptosporangiaceae bacterium NEAU-GS5]|nr:hypothetical protein [Streptosporangiaceae bacterium NEAU-GS5]